MLQKVAPSKVEYLSALILESSHRERHWIRDTLKDLGLRDIAVARNVVEWTPALRTLKASAIQPGIVVIDFVDEELTAFERLNLVSKITEYPYIKTAYVAVISEELGADERKIAIRLGVSGFIDEPVERQKLREWVASILAQGSEPNI